MLGLKLVCLISEEPNQTTYSTLIYTNKRSSYGWFVELCNDKLIYAMARTELKNKLKLKTWFSHLDNTFVVWTEKLAYHGSKNGDKITFLNVPVIETDYDTQ